MYQLSREGHSIACLKLLYVPYPRPYTLNPINPNPKPKFGQPKVLWRLSVLQPHRVKHGLRPDAWRVLDLPVGGSSYLFRFHCYGFYQFL